MDRKSFAIIGIVYTAVVSAGCAAADGDNAADVDEPTRAEEAVVTKRCPTTIAFTLRTSALEPDREAESSFRSLRSALRQSGSVPVRLERADTSAGKCTYRGAESSVEGTLATRAGKDLLSFYTRVPVGGYFVRVSVAALKQGGAYVVAPGARAEIYTLRESTFGYQYVRVAVAAIDGT